MRIVKWMVGILGALVVLFCVAMFVFFGRDAPLIVRAFVRAFWGVYIEPRLCSASEKIVTKEKAPAFAKDYLRKDKIFWRSVGVSDSEEIEKALSCKYCVADKGDYQLNDDSRWTVNIRAWNSLNYPVSYSFVYQVFFSECGTQVRVEKSSIAN